MEEPPREIIGVAGDVRDGALNREPNPIMYVPWAQLPDAHSANLLEDHGDRVGGSHARRALYLVRIHSETTARCERRIAGCASASDG